MDYRILGPLEVASDGRACEIGSHRLQTLLGVLLLHPREVISTERLIDELWGEAPPPNATKALQVYVSRLRRAIGSEAIVTRGGGYLVAAEPDALDAARFERLTAAGRDSLAANDPQQAASQFTEALALWRGEPLEGVRFGGRSARADVERLAEARLAVQEGRIAADLAAGRHSERVAELQVLARAHPYREGLRAQLMLALYRCGRQSEALDVFHDTRRLLDAELGLQPSEQLVRLQSQMLAHDPQLDAPPDAGPVLVAPPALERRPDERRLVTVLAARSTAPDPEIQHAVLDRCTTAVERLGGTVERYLGDTVICLFGALSSREDDPQRAVRAAVELRDADAAALQFGIDSGEIFVSTRPDGTSLATGEAISAAARLAQAASSGEIVLGPGARRSLAATVRVEPASGRLLELRAEDEALGGAPTTPFVGRRRELGELRAAFERVRAERGCRVVTVVGPPGLGKSRLARELTRGIGDAATVLAGGCRSFGEGVTYQAIADMVRGLGDDPGARIKRLLAGDERAVRGVLGAAGLADEPAQSEETAWAVRRLFERLAAERPLAVVVEDIHWAEPPLLDLLDYVAAFSRDAPILLLCLTRPDLIETRPSWAAPQPDRSLLALEPLDDADAARLVEAIGGDARAASIVHAAEGNPLFLEQLVAVDAGAPDTRLPTTIQAVLAARIDRLEQAERSVLRHAAVEGRTFHAGAVAALLEPEQGEAVETRLVGLARKGLIRAERARVAGDDAFRFDHALIRETAYQGIPKRNRAQMHGALADWMDARPEAADEVVAFHCEESCRLAAELGIAGERERELAARAVRRLDRAGHAALTRGDLPAAASLLERAVALLEPGDRSRAALLPALGAALFDAGRVADAERVLADAVAGAAEPSLAAHAQVEQQFVLLETDPGHGAERARRVADAALRVFDRRGDEHGRSRAWSLRAISAWIEGRVAEADDAWRRAADSASAAGEERVLFEILVWRSSAAVIGPTPVDEAIRRCEAFRQQMQPSPFAVAMMLPALGALHAMAGDFVHARELVRKADAVLQDLGGLQSAAPHYEAQVEMLAGEPARAEQILRTGYDKLAAMADGSLLATTVAMLSRAVCAQGRLEEAEELSRISERVAPADDIVTHVIWRGARARALAGRGACDDAEALAREAVALVERTDLLTYHGDALLDLAEVLRARGRDEEAKRIWRGALALYERKGNLAAAKLPGFR